MVTIKDIARRAGVSRGTVDRVINGRPGVNPETMAVIRTLMEEMGYHPNAAGQMLAAWKRKLRLAFLIVDGPSFVFFHDILVAAQEKAAELQELGVTVDFYLIQQFDRPYLEKLLGEVEASAPDGIAALPLRTKPFITFMEHVNARGISTVFFNTDENFAHRLCYVGCDYARAGQVAAGLAALCTGNQGKVGIVTCDGPSALSFTARMSGFGSELKKRYPKVILADNGIPAIFYDNEYTQVEKLLCSHPDLRALYIVNLGDFSVCQRVQEMVGGRHLAVITNDLVPVQKKLLKKGSISATISQQPEAQGALPLQILFDHLILGKHPPQDKIMTTLDIHVAQNA